MANKTSLVITSTDQSGKTFNKTYTCVNSGASAENLQTFAQSLNGLTKNTYGSAALVERTEIVNSSNLPLARVKFTINGRTYTEADADTTVTPWPVLTLTFNASDTQHVITNSDGRKEVRFNIDYIETFAAAYSCWEMEMWNKGYPRITFGIDPDNAICSGSALGLTPSPVTLRMVRCEFYSEGNYKDREAVLSIGGTKTRRGWKIKIKLNREA